MFRINPKSYSSFTKIALSIKDVFKLHQQLKYNGNNTGNIPSFTQARRRF
jgi:hypothetical protein